MEHTWKKCSVCKTAIPHESRYYECSVSTCNRQRTQLAFCSVECWDAHLPIAKHRPDAGAIEKTAPALEQLTVTTSQPAQPKRVTLAAPPMPMEDARSAKSEPLHTEILVVVSKVKKYVREQSGMNTSASVMEELTKCITAICDKAIENAQRAERKTVLDRDIPDIIV